MSSDVRLVLVTAPPDEAPTLARHLVEERMVACVNLFPGITSVYRWSGEVEEARETVLLAKTTTARLEEVRRRVTQLHSYEVPEFLVLSVESGLDAYLGWVADQTARID